MWKAFKDFAFKGEAIALAVGVVMGAAFNAIVNSIVVNIFNPLIGFLLGGTDLNNKIIVILNGNPPGPYATVADATKAGALFIGWGAVIAAIVNFLVIAVALFIIVELVARVAKQPDPTTKDCPYCAREIPIAASRCPECTSQLEQKPAEA